jgi:hypothetical protein
MSIDALDFRRLLLDDYISTCGMAVVKYRARPSKWETVYSYTDGTMNVYQSLCVIFFFLLSDERVEGAGART